MKKFLISFILVSLLSASGVKAVDLTVTCDGTSCDTSPAGNAALFEVNNWLPGETLTQTINVSNGDQEGEGDDCNLYMALKNKKQTPADFASRIFTVIKEGASDLFGIRNGSSYASSDKTLQDLYTSGAIFLKTIPFGSSTAFDWTATFDSTTGNYYQGAKTTFDFDLSFTCGVEPAPTSTPVPTATSVPGPNPTSVPPPGCDDPTPGIPSGLYAVVGPGAGQVTLYWTAPARPYTYFLIAYSDSPDWPPKWGNPDVGDTSSYTVSGLGVGTYWFWVRAGNGCMPGEYTGPVSPGAIAGISTGGIAEGFQEGVLGTQEGLEGELDGGISSQEGALVEGAKTQKVCPFWWIVLIGQTVVLGIFYALNSRRKEWIKRWWLMTVATILLAYFIDYYAHTRWYIPSKMCSWEKCLGILLAGAETTLFRKVWFDKMKKLLLSFAFILLFFLLSSSVFAIEIKNKIQVSSSAGFETQERDFQAGERVYVRLPLGSGGDKEKTLKLLDSEKKEVLRQDFEISGGMYSASFIAPNKEGVYYLDIKIDNGQGSVFTSQQNINIGEVTGEAVSSSAESKVEVNVTGRAVKISEIEITPELEIPKEPITFIGKMNFWWRRFLSNLTNWLK